MPTVLFVYLKERGADFLCAVKHCRRKGFQEIVNRLSYRKRGLFKASKHEVGHGRDITWTLRGMPAPHWVVANWPGSTTVISVRRQGRRDGKTVDESRYHLTNLLTSASALLRHVRDRWRIENSWHWPRDTQLREDAHRYRETNGVQILAMLRSLALNALRLDGFCSITEGLAALYHDIRCLLALLGWKRSGPKPSG
jgi:predicted transposase YbfD/YdcC